MIVADTHAWIWWATGSRRLSKRARAAFEEADAIGVAAITLWEIAMLVRHQRLVLDRGVSLWLRQSLAKPRAALLPLDPDVATRAVALEWEHRDPADRLIVATALVHRAALVSRDERMSRFDGIRTIW
ncbi:MAG: type II toxin-antitoxin system VapC family toxin [Thermoanaerobaculia bacterium]